MQISPLNPGDLIAIVSPAKLIDAQKVQYAKNFLEEKGFRIWIAPHTTGEYHYFSGTDEERIADFQAALNNPEVKAILCARGGYGSIRIIDVIDWTSQLKNPKWIIGFSDITVFHQWMNAHDLPSIHATVPLNFQDTSEMSLKTLLQTLMTSTFEYTLPASNLNLKGTTEGMLVGGNLSIIYSLIGTNLQPNYQGKILFVEEVGEALYAIDRMFYSFEKSQILNEISGLIIGGVTELRDSDPGFGQSVEEIITAHVADKGIPVCFNFPAGHQKENWALILGSNVQLSVTKEKVTVKTVEI